MFGFFSKKLSESQMALFNILSTGIVGAVSLFTVPIFTRVLDQDAYGLTSVYTAWVQIFSVVVGLQVSGSIGSAYANLREDEQDSYQLSILILALASFVVTLGIVLILLMPLSDILEMPPSMVLCALVQSIGMCVVGVFNKRYIFKKQAQSNLVLSVLVSLSSSVLAVILVVIEPWGLSSYLAWAIGYVVPPAAIGLIMIGWLMVGSKAKMRIRYWSFCLTITLPVILHALSGVALGQLGRLGIQHVYGDAVAGIYGIGITAASIIASLYSALNSAFVPFMYDDLAGKTGESTKAVHFKNYMVLFTVMTCIYMLVGPEVVKALSPPDYWQAIELVPVLIMGNYFVFLYSFPVNYEFYKMKTASVGIGTLLAAILNAVLVVLWIPGFGMMGAAAATAISYGFLFLFHFLIARFHLGDKNYPARDYAIGVSSVFAIALIVFISQDAYLLRWGMAIVLSIGLGKRLLRIRTIF